MGALLNRLSVSLYTFTYIWVRVPEWAKCDSLNALHDMQDMWLTQIRLNYTYISHAALNLLYEVDICKCGCVYLLPLHTPTIRRTVWKKRNLDDLFDVNLLKKCHSRQDVQITDVLYIFIWRWGDEKWQKSFYLSCRLIHVWPGFRVGNLIFSFLTLFFTHTRALHFGDGTLSWIIKSYNLYNI